jgi:mxaK protein
MALVRGRRTRGALLLLVALFVAIAWHAYEWRALTRWNQRIASQSLANLPQDAPAEVRFAAAYALAGRGDDQSALNHYRELHDDAHLGLAARYNSANIFMRQAMVLQASATPGQAIPLVELAKENYREVLRADPGFWDARYNFERAQRLLPDPEDNEPATSETPRGAERAATTMRGYSPGLP